LRVILQLRAADWKTLTILECETRDIKDLERRIVRFPGKVPKSP
jgi:G:T-mismatch repair DNA endonuclease (very short patch repair protein)